MIIVESIWICTFRDNSRLNSCMLRNIATKCSQISAEMLKDIHNARLPIDCNGGLKYGQNNTRLLPIYNPQRANVAADVGRDMWRLLFSMVVLLIVGR